MTINKPMGFKNTPSAAIHTMKGSYNKLYGGIELIIEFTI
jgi:hypothetical protein